jgi:RND family efflux transporter MFP subunit
MNPDVDLRPLAVRRDGPTAPTPARRRRHLTTRYLLPGAVLLGFLGVMAWSARDSLRPSRPVTVVPVLATRAEVRQGGAPLFQAAGWVEPRPTPVLVTALTEGVVDQLMVVEGQAVKAGQPVARLIDADARLALAAAEADLRLRKSELAGARAALAAARTNARHPLRLKSAFAEAEAMLAQKETELGNLPFQLRAAEARLHLARVDYNNKRKAFQSKAVPERTFLLADSELKTATAAVEELKARQPRLKREASALAGKRDALARRLELKTEETQKSAEAEAALEGARARLEQAQVAVDAARLRLERMVLRAPISGRVLALAARPGMRLMGLAPHALHDASTVLTLYDPARLQVRADVRLEDVPRVRPGQPARIEAQAVPDGPLDGVVLFATSQADLQKNTLQVKVAVTNPPSVLTPDMLVRVTFLAPPRPDVKPGPSEQLRLLVPRQLVEVEGGGARVWVADRVAGVARLRPVQLGPGAADDLVEVVAGLNAADKLIAGGREGLADGQRITVTGEDPTLGTKARGPGPKRAPPARTPPGNGGHHGNP